MSLTSHDYNPNVPLLRSVARHIDDTKEPVAVVRNNILTVNNPISTKFDKWRFDILKNTISENLVKNLRIYGLENCAIAASRMRRTAYYRPRNLRGLDLNKDKIILNPKETYAIEIYNKVGNEFVFDRTIEVTGDLKDHFKLLEDEGIFFQSHHIFSRELFGNEAFAKWYESIGNLSFDVNELPNLIMLENVSNLAGRGVHTKHPEYTGRIAEYLDDRYGLHYRTIGDAAIQEINLDILFLAPNLKAKLLEKSLVKPTFVNSQFQPTKVNDLWNENGVFESLIRK